MATNVGILHPGAMGVSIAATMANSGYTVWWASEGRSEASRARAAEQQFQDAGSLAELCARCAVIVSVCPPHAAAATADAVIAQGWRGLYLDANAIAPNNAQRIGAAISAAGGTFVDGSIIGGPAWEPGKTWLYLSGAAADEMAAYFAAGPLETEVIGGEIGKASALKMCFAANTKGAMALLCAVAAAAEQLGVRDELERQWSRWEAGSRGAERTAHPAGDAEGVALRRRDGADRRHVRSSGRAGWLSARGGGRVSADGGVQGRGRSAGVRGRAAGAAEKLTPSPTLPGNLWLPLLRGREQAHNGLR